MSLGVKRSAKSAALGLVAARNTPRPDYISSTALNMMRIGLEPGAEAGYDGGRPSAACVSVDFDVTLEERRNWNHDGTAALLGESEGHEIPLTWAICGKTADEDRRAYESIAASRIQEIGIHTYSHIYANSTPEEQYESDIERCIATLGLSSRPTTFVFPKNIEGHFDLLRRMGFRTYRGARRVIGAPTSHDGLWNIRPVYYVDSKSLKATKLILKFVDACIARSAVFHLWTHPWSLAISGKVDRMTSEVIRPVFAYLEEKSKTGEVSLTTMGALARHLGQA